MNKYRKSIVIALAVPLLELTFCSARAYPQPKQDAWSDMAESLTAGMPIEVDEFNHAKIKGKFVAITPTNLSLWVKNRQVNIHRSDISKVKKNHANFLKGVALFGGGGALLGVGALWASAIGSHHPETDSDSAASKAAVGVMVVGAATAFVAAPMEIYGHYTLYTAGKLKNSGKPVSPPSGSRLQLPTATPSPKAAPAARTLFQIRADTSWGCINREGTIVVALQPFPSGPPAELCKGSPKAAEPALPKDSFGTLGDFHEGLAIASPDSDTRNGWGELDGILPPSYVRVKKGYIDTSGRYVIPPQYLDLGQFSGGLAAVRVGRHKWTYIDRTGKPAMPKSFYMAGRFSEGLAPVVINDFWRGNKVGFIDKTGRIIITPKFERARPFVGGLARVEIAGKWGYIDESGKMVIPANFDLAGDFSEGLAAVNIGATEENKKDWRTSVNCCMPAEQKEDILVRPMMSPASLFGYGSSTPVLHRDFSERNPWCFSHVTGDISSDGKEYVGGEWGYIDRTGKIVIQPQYSGALRFSGGLAQVFARGKCSNQDKSSWMAPAEKFGYIDATGKFVWREGGWPGD